MKATQLTEDSVCTHGEGPLWDPRSGRLLCVDMLAGDVLALDPAGHNGARPIPTTRHHVGDVAAAIRPRRSGGFVVATERGFCFTDSDLQVIEQLPAVFDTPQVRMNDGGCDPQGRFLCGSMAQPAETGAGTLYRLNTDHSIDVVLSEVTISNGIQWSADGTAMFYIDTPLKRIDQFDVDPTTGEISNRRVFAEVEAPGAPDGMAIDAEDGLWVALWGGHAVRRYAPDGTVSATVELPVPYVTACAFGGEDLKTLFITTSRTPDPEGPAAAGAVFAVEPGVSGVRPLDYAG